MSFRFKLLVIILVLVLAGSIFSRSRLSGLLRANRWDKIEQLFQNRTPYHDQESYAVALAILKNKKPAKTAASLTKVIRAFRYFFSILNVSCPNAKDKKVLLRCLRSSRVESRSTNMERMAAWQASVQAGRHNMPGLSLRFITLASLKPMDPLAEKIFQQRLGQLIRNKSYSSALVLARRRDAMGLDSPFSDFLRARTFAHSGQKKRALSLYFKAAWVTTAKWLQESIIADIKNFYPDHLQQERLSTKNSINRNLLSLSEQLSKGQIKALRKGYGPQSVIGSSNTRRFRRDGIFLIRSGYSNSLRALGRRFHGQLSRDAKPLKEWVSYLRSLDKESQAFRLLGAFKSLLPESSVLWSNYIDLLGKKYNKRNKKYFDEVLRYLQVYPQHTSMQELLVERLIGSNSKKIQWAPYGFWEKTKKKLPRHSASGRFFYWLRRYYEQHNRRAEMEELDRNFYVYAPGSLYVTEIWAKGRAKHHVGEWRSVNSRRDYLRWLGQYGGRSDTVRFLRRKYVQKYQDPRAGRIWADLKRLGTPKNDMVRLLFELGEWQMGTQFFRKIHADTLSRRQYLLRLIQLGSWSKTLNVQIYYLRQLLRKEGVSIEPFSLPFPLSKLLYPRPYRKLVRKYSKHYGLQESMSYALMHQESLFQENAISRTGARGLMQIMPGTGKWLAGFLFKGQRLNIKDPTTNIHLGTYYFSKLMKKNQNDFRWAAIAYNGGPGNLRKWKKQHYNGDFYHFLERLPNREARNYCRITYENYLRYKTIYSLTH